MKWARWCIRKAWAGVRTPSCRSSRIERLRLWRLPLPPSRRGACCCQGGPAKAPQARLARLPAEGLAMEPLYEAAAPVAVPARAALGWDIRAPVRAASPTDANTQILEALAGGASSVLVSLGAEGVAVGDADGLA